MTDTEKARCTGRLDRARGTGNRIIAGPEQTGAGDGDRGERESVTFTTETLATKPVGESQAAAQGCSPRRIGWCARSVLGEEQVVVMSGGFYLMYTPADGKRCRTEVPGGARGNFEAGGKTKPVIGRTRGRFPRWRPGRIWKAT